MVLTVVGRAAEPLPGVATLRMANLAMEPSRAALAADPVTLAPTLDNLIFAGRVDDLDATDSAELEALVRTIAGDALTDVSVPCDGAGVARLARPLASALPDPAILLGRGLRGILSASAVASELRQLDAELQLALHSAPLNARRLDAGRRPITHVWFWGAATTWSAQSRSLPQLFTRDATLRAFWIETGNEAKLCASAEAAVQARDETMIVATSPGDLAAVRAALAKRSRWQRWRRDVRAYDQLGAPLALTALESS